MGNKEISNQILTNKLKNVTSGTPTLGPKFSGTAMYIENGQWCMLVMEVTPNGDVANGDIVLSGLPKPQSVIYCGLTTGAGIYTATIDQNGDLKIYYPSFTSAARIDFTITYLIGAQL